MSESTIRIAVVFGGRTGEHEVSCRSGAAILANLDPARYTPVPTLITKGGDWVFGDDAPVDTMTALRTLADMDVVFPALHGPYGEDGTIQAVLELIGVPYVGNGVLASAAGIDKAVTKKLLAADGLPVADSVLLAGHDPLPDRAVLDRLGLPAFVKPSRAGSSLGVSRVEDWSELAEAVAVARACDPKVLIEEAVLGREVDLAVLEHPDGRLEVGPALEIRVAQGRSFFDYEAKYADPSTIFDIPAPLDPSITATLNDLAVRVFRALDCSGLLRIDFFLRDGVEPVINEVNTFPGFTPVSQYPQIWQVAGLGYPELLDILIATGMARTRRSAVLTGGPAR
jgi:D-alanine-D-alanine ligase